jgi:hypothetical protein
MKKTKKRIHKKQTKKKQTKKKQTKKKQTFYIQLGGPINKEDNTRLISDVEAAAEARKIIEPEKATARNLIGDITNFLTECNIGIVYIKNLDNSITIYLYLLADNGQPIYFYYTTYKHITIEPQEVDYEFNFPVEEWPISVKKIIINAPKKYKRQILRITTTLCVLNGYSFAIFIQTLIMAQALLDNIIFARKEDTTDAAGSLRNFNNLLGFWTSEELELVYRDYLNFPGGMSFIKYLQSIPEPEETFYGEALKEGERPIRITGDELAINDSPDEDFSTQDAETEEAKESQHSSVFGSQSQTSSVGSQSQEEVDVSAANPSKFAIIPLSLTYLAEIIGTRIEEKKEAFLRFLRFLRTKPAVLVETIQEKIQELERNDEGWQFTNPDPPVRFDLQPGMQYFFRQVDRDLIPVRTLKDLM